MNERQRLIENHKKTLEGLEPLNESIWGPMPSPERVVEVEIKNDRGLRNEAKKAIYSSYESQLFALSLGISVQELWKMGRENVARFSIGVTKFYPKWQLKAGKLIDGLGELIAAWNENPQTTSPDTEMLDFTRFMTRPIRRLEDRKPTDCLRDGELPLVLEVIREVRIPSGM